MFFQRSSNEWWKIPLPRTRKQKQFQFEAWPNLGNFPIWWMNFRCEVSWDASRLTRSTDRIHEVESAKYTAELKTSNAIMGAKLQKNFEILDPKSSEVKKTGNMKKTKNGKKKQKKTQKLKNGNHQRRLQQKSYLLFFLKKLPRKGTALSREGRSHGWSTRTSMSATRTNPSWTWRSSWRTTTCRRSTCDGARPSPRWWSSKTTIIWKHFTVASVDSQSSRRSCCLCSFEILFKSVIRGDARLQNMVVQDLNRQFVRSISLLAKVNLKRSASGGAAAMGSLGRRKKTKVNGLLEKSV